MADFPARAVTIIPTWGEVELAGAPLTDLVFGAVPVVITLGPSLIADTVSAPHVRSAIWIGFAVGVEIVAFAPFTPGRIAAVFIFFTFGVADTLVVNAVLTCGAIAPVVALDSELAHIVDTQGAVWAVTVVPAPILFTFAETIVTPLTRWTIRVAFALGRWD